MFWYCLLSVSLFALFVTVGKKPTTPAPVAKSRKFKRMKQSVSLTPRGSRTGPKRTPVNLGDAWQHKSEYEVEKVRIPACVVFISQCNSQY